MSRTARRRWIGFCGSATLCLLLAGCGTMRITGQLGPVEPAPYMCVAGDIFMGSAGVSSGIQGEPGGWLLGSMYFLDLPVALVVDTVFLPFDVYRLLAQ